MGQKIIEVSALENVIKLHIFILTFPLLATLNTRYKVFNFLKISIVSIAHALPWKIRNSVHFRTPSDLSQASPSTLSCVSTGTHSLPPFLVITQPQTFTSIDGDFLFFDEAQETFFLACEQGCTFKCFKKIVIHYFSFWHTLILPFWSVTFHGVRNKFLKEGEGIS